MKRKTRGSWWGLYALIPVAAALLYLAHTLRTGQALHLILLLAVVIGVPVLALLWSERHTGLMGSEGVDALAEQDALATLGCLPGRFEPSLTTRQAHYRSIMLAQPWGASQKDET